MKLILILTALLTAGCATPRNGSIVGLRFSDMPPRALVRAQCNGQNFTTQGIVVCEQKAPSTAVVSIKVPPLQGRVVYSNGQMKRTDDFNWYPETGIWFWKKQQIKDTWAPLDLGEIQATFGDWPVALDIMGLSQVGIINTRGVLYYRICDDKEVPCSHLVVKYMCQGWPKATGNNDIGKCDRMAGTPQDFVVSLREQAYAATAGAKLYVSAPRSSFQKVFDISRDDLNNGAYKFQIPNIESGPTLIGFRLSYYDANRQLVSLETRVLLMGTDPEWTGLDRPHYIDRGKTLRFIKPILSDQMEVERYNNGSVTEKQFTTSGMIDFDKPTSSQVVCAFAWQRDSSDLTAVCLDSKMNEVKIP